MTEATRTELSPGVYLTTVHTRKFKSAVLSASFLTPLERDKAALRALVPQVLRRGTAAHPDMNALSRALDELYGGSIEPMVRKRGETQCVGFVGSFLDDAYTLHGEGILPQAAGLLCDLLLRPCTVEGRFVPEYVVGEKSNLIDRIHSRINDKRQYSILRLTQSMCADEAFGCDSLGEETAATAIDGESLWFAYQELLSTARMELYYCGSADPKQVESIFRAALADLPVNEDRMKLNCQVKNKPEQGAPRFVEEALDVTQGKLAMGFRTDGICVGHEDYPALVAFNSVYGGSTMSKLFMNVREAKSLCYYASSMLEKHKGIMLVSSGIEFEKAQEAREEILRQLESCRRGEIEDWELVGSIRSVITALQTIQDSQGRLEDFWLGQAVAGLTQGPEDLMAKLEQVTAEQVADIARRVTLDTVYFLKGQEETA